MERADELFLGVLETAVGGPDAVPDDVHLLRERLPAHLLDVLLQLPQDRRAVLADFQAPGVQHAEMAADVQVEMAALSDGRADPRLGDLLTEDRVDECALADARLAEDREVEAPDAAALLLELRAELLAEPVLRLLCHRRIPSVSLSFRQRRGCRTTKRDAPVAGPLISVPHPWASPVPAFPTGRWSPMA